ncbi:hypothetical protein BRADI_2g00845v3 [Brachypodium distachyon]|uniref:Uncharacterized protein n=2 Tax=Brachypodium distachyon TaxID=15368 RepID=A0A2K2D6A1_BRADI|nr:hypothetical protein BRADI_2g00845v3 [Brachypodium distachyon]
MTDLSAEKLRSILAEAEKAAKKIRTQRDHLLLSQAMLEGDAPAPPSDDAGGIDIERLKGMVSGQIEKFRYEGLDAGARDLTAVLTMAGAEGGGVASLALNSSFPVMPEELLHHALLAHHAADEIPVFARVEAALFAVKLARERHLPRCVDHVRRIDAGEPLQAAGGGGENVPPALDPATGLPLPGSATEQARACLDRPLALVNLAVAAMSSFLDQKEAADDIIT